jgi:hypothetical protein
MFQPWNWYRENYSIVQSQSDKPGILNYSLHYFSQAESRSPAWPCNAELAQPSNKEYDSDYSDDDNEMDEL